MFHHFVYFPVIGAENVTLNNPSLDISDIGQFCSKFFT